MKGRLKPVGASLILWDLGWKVVAIRRAIQRREYWWIAPLAAVNSVGLLPMLYLARTRKPPPRGERSRDMDTGA
jgi:hypothetical protein